jgi:hypothetical protein
LDCMVCASTGHHSLAVGHPAHSRHHLRHEHQQRKAAAAAAQRQDHTILHGCGKI